MLKEAQGADYRWRGASEWLWRPVGLEGVGARAAEERRASVEKELDGQAEAVFNPLERRDFIISRLGVSIRCQTACRGSLQPI
jgi:hypothetical protein